MASDKKIAANRINGQKSRGPKDTTRTRLNSAKHGLTAAGITELDDAESYRAILENLRKEKEPVGVIENMLVEAIALDMVRSQRARRLEAEFITSELYPPTFDLSFVTEPVIIDPGRPPAIGFEGAQRLVNSYQRYESTFMNRILRLLHELERLQCIRHGERLPAPAVVDVSVHASMPSFSETLESSNAVAIETPGRSDEPRSPVALLEEEFDSEAPEDSSTDCETNPASRLFST